MKILVSNDDGIYANGIKALVDQIAEEHEVYVVAPDRERSAAGHSLTLHTPLRADIVERDWKAKKAWAISGTPGDCVKLGLNAILDVRPDLIISGINHGPNLGADVLYSGTVSAALEGAVLGVPSIATSLAGVGNEYKDFVYTAQFVRDFLRKMEVMNLPKKAVLNINVPGIDSADILGAQITRLGTRMFTDTYEKRVDP
ncbi:MAG: 5'/3'-nucleotidase SurE, partial [Candidatus Gastranaerophilales bacterium]|nr:5'/3'-nucleotidase SurE [Candidatus Gastranaerophilales bacterium]